MDDFMIKLSQSGWWVLSLLAIACGGSSSETPPPLEPSQSSQSRFPRAATSRPPQPSAGAATEADAAASDADAAASEPDAMAPTDTLAPSTWGDAAERRDE
jgi:hypothetical protein